MKKVTCWYCRQPHQSRYKYNHLEYGWSEELEPKAKTDVQRKAWAGLKWIAVHATMDEQNVVTEPL